MPARPLERPLGLAAHGVEVVDGVEELVLLLRVLDVRVDHEAVHLAVDVLDGDLEAVEGARLHARGREACMGSSRGAARAAGVCRLQICGILEAECGQADERAPLATGSPS